MGEAKLENLSASHGAIAPISFGVTYYILSPINEADNPLTGGWGTKIGGGYNIQII